MHNLLSLFNYTFIDNKSSRTLFLLHGTGGDENDFLFLNDRLKKTYNLVGLRGNIVEHGMNRFFKRNSSGVFDQDSIKEESEKLRLFISEWQKIHHLTNEQCTFLGYSNGANILLAILFYFPQLIKSALLLHPMLPFVPTESVDLSNHHIFLSYGENDEMVSTIQSQKIVDLLNKFGAKLDQYTYHEGHALIDEEFSDILKFLGIMNESEE